jgi:coenzyme F420-reducing hydrogenase beta subunit
VKKLYKMARDKIWHRHFSEEEINKYVGYYERCYYTYATDETLRRHAASGGSVSGLLVYLLESGQIDGALVCDTVIREGKARAQFRIARSREEIMRAQGSKYSAVYFAQDALPLIRAFDGKLAVVALPCDARILYNTRQKHPDLDAKIALVIALFCGHNSEPELTDLTVAKLNDGHGELTDYVYRSGHWRGQLTATFADGAEVTKPFSYFSDYRNLYFFAQKKCHHCFDHFGYFCDVSAGDIWSPEMKNEPIKHTALITRTERGSEIVTKALAAGALTGRAEGVTDIANGQARTMPFHYNISARSKVGRWLGVKIRDETRERVRWQDYVVAGMALVNQRVTSTAAGRRLVMAIPRPVVKAYLYLLKGLESI